MNYIDNLDFQLPKYDGESLLNLPSTILEIFNLNPINKPLLKNLYCKTERSEKVIFFLIDGFGFELFQKKAVKYPFFELINYRKMVKPITTVFPSTTAAAITTINSGLSPLVHGLPEWFVYFEELDAVLQSLPFAPVIEEDRSKTLNPPPGILFSGDNLYTTLQASGIPSYCFLQRSLADSFYNVTANKGSTNVSYIEITDLFVNLRNMLTNIPGKAYFYVYLSEIDTAEHLFGPYTPEVESGLSLLSYMLKNEFVDKLDKEVASKTTMFLSADHGQIPVNPEQTIYLDQIPGLVEKFSLSVNNKIIAPSGGCRDVFLHIKEDQVLSTLQLLQSYLKDKAIVVLTDEAIKNGLFGPGVIHPKIKSKLGNVLILATGNNTIWYHFSPETKFTNKGYHGGLSKEEMVIPLISANLGDLKS